MSAAALWTADSGWRRLLWRHPESWAFLLSAGAWSFCIATSGHAGHHHGGGALAKWAAHWPLMIAAMMYPLLVGQLRFVAARSFWSRRNRAMVMFLAGYSALWLMFGLAAEAFLEGLRSQITFLAPLSFLAAAGWQLTAPKRASLVGCHLTMPLTPSGWRADWDCCRYGLRSSAYYCLGCWALMLACAACGHALWCMALVTVVTWAERLVREPRQLWFSLALLAVAVLMEAV